MYKESIKQAPKVIELKINKNKKFVTEHITNSVFKYTNIRKSSSVIFTKLKIRG